MRASNKRGLSPNPDDDTITKRVKDGSQPESHSQIVSTASDIMMDVDSMTTKEIQSTSSDIRGDTIHSSVLHGAHHLTFNGSINVLTGVENRIINTSPEDELTVNIAKFKQWLAPPDPSTNFNNAVKNCFSDTGTWLLNSPVYMEWKHNRNSFMWIHGISGSGKTILCSTLIKGIQEQIARSKSVKLAYFFCDINDINKRAVGGLLCSIVLSLLASENGGTLRDLYSKCNHGLQKPTDHDLCEVLRTYISALQDVYIFIDALDECGNVEEILKLVKLIHGWKFDGCHLLVTSRNELQIANSLRLSAPAEVDLSHMPLHHDITKYIDHILASEDKLKKWPQSEKALIKETLMEKGKGMFRWVVCQLEELKHCSKSPKMLQDVLNGLPMTLESTYDQILSRIKAADASNAVKLILWLTFAERPLHIEDLAQVVEFDVDRKMFDPYAKLYYPDDVLNICSSLVTKMEDETVQFSHASIKEYFHTKPRTISLSAQVDPSFGHFFVGQCSLAYIFHTKETYPDGIDHDDVPQRFEDSLLKYSAYFWPKHILACNKELAVMDDIMKLFHPTSPPLIKWVKAYNYGHYKSAFMLYSNHLQISAIHGLIETCSHLMKRSVTSVEHMEALCAAACNSHGNIVQLLMEKGKVDWCSADLGIALTDASENGDIQIVRLILGHERSGIIPHEFLQQALYYAACTHHLDIIQLIFGTCSDLDIGAAVQGAANRGHLDVVIWMLERVPNLGEKHEVIRRALVGAIENGNKDMVEFLLKLKEVDSSTEASALVTASYNAHIDIIKLLLGRGADVNALGKAQFNYHEHALHAAIPHYEIVVFLLKYGANVNLKGGRFGNALQKASFLGQKDIVQLLLDSGADVNAPGGEWGYPLWAALLRGHKAIATLLLQYGASLGIYEGYDSEALYAASRGGHTGVVELLLDKGINVNAKVNNIYGTAILGASQEGHKDIVELLLRRGAHVNLFSDSRGTALHAASYYGHEDVVKLLYDWGAEVNAVCGWTGTALQAASCHGHKHIVELLLAWGADVNLQAGDFGSALQIASYAGKKDIVELLIKSEADVNMQGGEHGSALQAAARNGYSEIVKLLLAGGARHFDSMDSQHDLMDDATISMESDES